MEANNMKAMRDALIQARSAICEFAKYQCKSLSWEKTNIQANCGDVLCSWRGLCKAKTAISAALAAPPRNCDRFNSGNAERDAQMAWGAITSGIGLQFSDLTDREIAIIKESMRGFVWLFTTANESEDAK